MSIKRTNGTTVAPGPISRFMERVASSESRSAKNRIRGVESKSSEATLFVNRQGRPTNPEECPKPSTPDQGNISDSDTQPQPETPTDTCKQWQPSSLRHHEGQSSDELHEDIRPATQWNHSLAHIGQIQVGESISAQDRYDFLAPLRPEEFLPPIGRWMVLGGIALLTALTVTTVLANVLGYTVTVKAPAVVRPAGELRLVQAAIGGAVKSIMVKENQKVTRGDPIALIDDSRLQTTRQQLRGNIERTVQQLEQVDAQLHAIGDQIAAETNRLKGAVLSAQATLKRSQREYQDRKTITDALMQEAVTAFKLTQYEVTRYRQLAETGAIAQITLREKEAALKTARAKLKSAQAALNPSGAGVEIAREELARKEALGQVNLKRLSQEREKLKQERLGKQNQIYRNRHELQQTETELTYTVIRAPASGTIQTLNLRNTSQVVQTGEVIAQIAPSEASLLIKAFVSSQDIDKARLAQRAEMRVSACPYPDYGTLKGIVSTISPDATRPTGNESGALHNTGIGATYEVTIRPESLSLTAQNNQCVLQSGMEGIIDIIAREETIMTFLLRKARLLTDL